jgi:FKBP-type peptidyl-prolyl cis-trans isomerase (trigger factor)
MENVEEVTSSRIQVSEQEYCKPEVTYHAEPSKVLEIRDQVLSELAEEASKIQISGYRKGKAPIAIIKENVQEMELLEEMAEVALSDNYVKILEENKIIPPEIDNKRLSNKEIAKILHGTKEKVAANIGSIRHRGYKLDRDIKNDSGSQIESDNAVTITQK